jgi:type IV secretory pathway VirB4 component
MKWRDRSAPTSVHAHETTTRHIGALYPCVVDSRNDDGGPLIGRDAFGAMFRFDPFKLYAAGHLTNPNLMVFGQIGRGKSSLVKTYLGRQLVFGRAAFVIDPKGEYRALAHCFGVEPLCLMRGGRLRLNPLDLGKGMPEDVRSRRLQLLEALVTSSRGSPPSSRERSAIELALDATSHECSVPTLQRVVERLLEPNVESASLINSEIAQLREDGRDVGLELRRLVYGDLQGIFDGETSAAIDLSSHLVVLDLSQLSGADALGVLMACAGSWMQGMIQHQRLVGRQSILVFDEAWAVLRDMGIARWLQASWKLARAWGVSNMAILHRVSDLSAVGSAGSEQRQLAEGILLDSESRIIYSQAEGELLAARELLHLNDVEQSVLTRLPRGVALWKFGSQTSIVRHVVAASERRIIDTDGAMQSE